MALAHDTSSRFVVTKFQISAICDSLLNFQHKRIYGLVLELGFTCIGCITCVYMNLDVRLELFSSILIWI